MLVGILLEMGLGCMLYGWEEVRVELVYGGRRRWIADYCFGHSGDDIGWLVLWDGVGGLMGLQLTLNLLNTTVQYVCTPLYSGLLYLDISF